MRIKATYRFIASLLCITLFTGFTLPALGVTEMMEHCADMMKMNGDESHHSELKMPEMDHSEMNECCMEDMAPDSQKNAFKHCETSIDCDCNFETQGIESKALAIQKLKLTPVIMEFMILEFDEFQSHRIPPPLWYSSSYSPPLLFLTNESFLI